jgi:hypothetical protein
VIDVSDLSGKERAQAELINKAAGLHNYVRYTDRIRIASGVGWGPGRRGSLPRQEMATMLEHESTKCWPCSKSCSRLEYGSGRGKLGVNARDSEIYQCLKATPAACDYSALGYNCMDWAYDAIEACGLRCTSPGYPGYPAGAGKLPAPWNPYGSHISP